MNETTQNDHGSVPAVGNIHPDQIRQHLKTLGRRQLWLGSTSVAVVLLLTIGVASFAFPGLLKSDPDYGFYLDQGIRALVGFVLVFSVYVIYQQLQIGRMRDQIATQIDCLAKVETLASEVYKLAALDQLTGLYNRRSGEQRMAQEISRAQRHSRPLTVLLIDLDGLKKINDTFGHQEGNRALVDTANVLRECFRESDILARLGGDEFAVFIAKAEESEIPGLTARMEHHLALCNAAAKRDYRLSFSTGIVSGGPRNTNVETLLALADTLMYQQKSARQSSRGGNTRSRQRNRQD